MGAIVRLGLKQLRQGEWGALKADKKGGFVAIKKSDMRWTLEKVMGTIFDPIAWIPQPYFFNSIKGYLEEVQHGTPLA